MNAFEWVDAKSVDEAIAQLGDGAMVKAGGVDVLDRLKEGLESPRRLVNIRNVKGLGEISFDKSSGLQLGPLATMARISEHATIREHYAALSDAAGHAATPQIRNMATVGGNLLQKPRCWYYRSEQFDCTKKGGEGCPASDGLNQYHAVFGNSVCAMVHPSAAATALVALGAKLELQGPDGKREVPIEEFFLTPEKDVKRENVLGPRELITAIRIPAPGAGQRSAYIKQGEKDSFDWPIAEAAVVLDMDGSTCRSARVVLGSAAPVPYRAKGAEAALAGKPLNTETIRAAAKAAVAGATPLSQNGYKVSVLEVIARRTMAAAGGVA